MNENNFNRFLQWEEADRDVIKVKRLYVDIAQDIIAGLLLSQIIYWYLPSKRGKSKLQVIKEGQLWLVKGRHDWWEECRITARQFDRAIELLIKLEIVEKRTFRFNGSPMIHIRLVPSRLLSCVNSVLEKNNHETPPANDDLGEIGYHGSVISNSPIRDIHVNESVTSISPIRDVHVNESVKTLTETTTEITTETPPYPPRFLSRLVKTKDEENALFPLEANNAETELTTEAPSCPPRFLSRPVKPKDDESAIFPPETNNTQTEIAAEKQKNPRRTKSSTKDTVPYNEIVEAYHAHCPALPRVMKITDARKKQIAARWKDNSDINVFADLFQRIEKSDFLINKDNANRNGWSCTLDWALNEQNMTKILEGRYDNKTVAPAPTQKEPQYSGWGQNVPDYVRQIVEASTQQRGS